MERSPVQRLQLVLLAILGALLVVLLASGLVLVYRYAPAAAHHPRSGAQVVHRSASALFVLVAVATFVVSIAVSLERGLRRGVPAWAMGVMLVLVALGASFTGYLLPWDQLALWAVKVGNDLRGYRAVLHGGDVRFILLGGAEVGRATFVRWFWVHTAVLPPLLLALGWVLGRRRSKHPAISA